MVKIYSNPWRFKGEELLPETIESYAGFVYLITNKVSGQRYIGKKFTKSIRKIKGKKRRQSISSDWWTYYGSSEVLKQQVEDLGKDNFTREILILCETRGKCNFAEVYCQMIAGVLFDDNWINDNIASRYFKKNVKDYFEKNELNFVNQILNNYGQ